MPTRSHKELVEESGNIILCSADVASALTMLGVLDYTPALNANLNVDDTGNTFAGTLNGKYRVYIDPYAANNSADQYYVVGYKGTSPYDAGLFYAHTFLSRWFVPLVRTPSAQDCSRPVTVLLPTHSAEAPPSGSRRLRVNNRYYRRVKVANLM